MRIGKHALYELGSNDSSLHVSGFTNVKDESASSVANEENQNAMLANLNLSGSNAQALTGCTLSTCLDLSRNRVSNEDINTITNTLTINKKLTGLCLEEVELDSAGAKAIALAVGQSNSVNELRLGWNQIDDEGAHAFADMLMINKSLTKLWLNNNSMTSVGVEAISMALRHNETLQYLWINGNKITDNGAESLLETLIDYNDTLTYLYIADPCDILMSSYIKQSIRDVMTDASGNDTKSGGSKHRIASKKYERKRHNAHDWLMLNWTTTKTEKRSNKRKL